ncbi:hypothetical protein L3N51_02356 [Metallosphaera sp. J1]|uniref:ATP-binding protein n=1 Tax=Metallosphaera javensis (ex Hofmann et al. 2022) TaxID=99938 RepID=UPI001EDF91CF|nr:ATP-binding protein [Metallosphaera javensis (ex Hofmann et al. 2022)]MCG3110059.1 hypothetical protein [Metallosphaera javensis (ex Hofmann et al. 2022)]
MRTWCRNTCTESREVYYFKNRVEIDVVAGEYRIEIKRARAHRGYPRDVMVLGEEDVPGFLLELDQQDAGS